MDTGDKIYLATKAFEKGWDGEAVRYGDDLYELQGEELDEVVEDVMEYMYELKQIGRVAFAEKYKGYPMY